MKKLAVIMPTYNAAQYLNESIDSVLNQTFNDFDLYIYDDCSTDATHTIIKSYTDSRIKYRKNIENSGIAITLNKGIKEVTNDYQYIARMDADDWCYPNRFEKQIEFLEANPAIAILGTQGHWVRNLEETTLSSWMYPVSNVSIRYNLLFTATFGHSSVAFRSAFFKNFAQYYDESIKTCEDWDFWRRISQVTQMANLPDFLMKYRIVSNSNHRSESKLKVHHQERAIVIAKHWSNFGIELTPDEVFKLYYDDQKNNTNEYNQDVKKWILLCNSLFEKAKSEMNPKELQSFGYLLSRRIVTYCKRNKLNPIIWLTILKELKVVSAFSLIKSCIK